MSDVQCGGMGIENGGSRIREVSSLLRICRILPILPLFALLGGCQMVLLGPSGDVALQQRNLLFASTALMLLVIVPVMALTIFFAWRYRAANKAVEKEYDPDWDHSTKLELLIWSAPLLIIICLGALTWVSTHKLDPYRPLDRIEPGRPTPEAVRPLQVNPPWQHGGWSPIRRRR